MNIREILTAVTGALALLTAAGCAHTPKSQMYILYSNRQALEPIPQYAPAATNKIIALDSIMLPQYVDQPVIVTRLNDYELLSSEFQRWGEPLATGLRSVIERNLSLLLHNRKIVNYRYANPAIVDLVVNITVTDLSGILGREARLAVRWSLSGQNNRKATAIIKSTTYTRKLKDATYGSYVVAQSKMLAEFCKELAADISKFCSEENSESDSKNSTESAEHK